MKGSFLNPVSVGVRGKYLLTTLKNGVVTKSTGLFPNMITNSGMDILGGTATGITSPANWFHHLQLGVGTKEVLATDVALDKYLVTSSSTAIFTTTLDTTNDWLVGKKTWSFLNGAAAGDLTEIGLGAALQGQLFSRSLIKNLYGQESTFTVLPDEDLYVTYLFFIKQPADYQSDGYIVRPKWKATISSVGWAFASNRFNFTAPVDNTSAAALTGDIAIPTSGPTGTRHPVSSANVVSETYVVGSHTRVFSYMLSRTQGNATLTSLDFIIGPTSWQLQLPVPIVKTGNDNYHFKVRLNWYRANNDAYYNE